MQSSLIEERVFNISKDMVFFDPSLEEGQDVYYPELSIFPNTQEYWTINLWEKKIKNPSSASFSPLVVANAYRASVIFSDNSTSIIYETRGNPGIVQSEGLVQFSRIPVNLASIENVGFQIAVEFMYIPLESKYVYGRHTRCTGSHKKWTTKVYIIS